MDSSRNRLHKVVGISTFDLKDVGTKPGTYLTEIEYWSELYGSYLSLRPERTHQPNTDNTQHVWHNRWLQACNIYNLSWIAMVAYGCHGWLHSAIHGIRGSLLQCTSNYVFNGRQWCKLLCRTMHTQVHCKCIVKSLNICTALTFFNHITAIYLYNVLNRVQ